MFSSNLRVEEFSVEDWRRLATAFRPERPRASNISNRPSGGLILVTHYGAPIKLLSTQKNLSSEEADDKPPAALKPGDETNAQEVNRESRQTTKREAPDDAPPSKSRLADIKHDLEALAKAHGARWALRIEWAQIDTLLDRFASRAQREHDALDQWVELVQVCIELEEAGQLESWPKRFSTLIIPSRRVRERAIESLCPQGKTSLLGIFSKRDLYTAIAVRRAEDGFDYVLGPAELRKEMGLLSGDWTRDYRHLLRAVETRLGPVSVGCFGELATFQDLSQRGNGWAAAVAARDILLTPVVPALAIPLGLDMGRSAFFALRDLAQRVGAQGLLSNLGPWAPALERVKAAVDERDLNSLLGFDPFELLKRLLADPEE